jgi:ATP-binding cassette subfamily C protein LapB
LVNLTRAFLRNPKIWLLDEPTASMDRALEHTIIQALKDRMGPEQTLFLVTHKPDLLALVDRIILIAGKKIVADGPKDAVLAQLSNQSAASASSVSQNVQSQAKTDVDSKPQGSRDE